MRNAMPNIIASLAISSTASAATRPLAEQIGTLPDGLGVNIHFTDPKPAEMKILADAGFRWVRMDFGWGATEREEGPYDFLTLRAADEGAGRAPHPADLHPRLL